MEVPQCSQGHPLILTKAHGIDGEEIDCAFCDTPTVDPIPTYGCDLCKFYAHEPCARLPRSIEHPFHPQHPLVLFCMARTSKFYGMEGWCCSCHRKLSNYFCYECRQCSFYMDVECATMGPITINEGYKCNNHIQHFSHQHPLLFIDYLNPNDGYYCFACHSLCEGPVYSCSRCGLFIHKFCAELPQEIKKHPIHPKHPLYLRLVHHNTCSGCSKAHCFLFFCDEQSCIFPYKCIECSFPPSNIQYRGHRHLLRLYEQVEGDLGCNAYYTYCKQEGVVWDDLKGTESYWFSCVGIGCSFYLHLMCGPLPCTLNSKCHIHPLHLIDSIVDEDDSDDEYYCDACETKRDPEICVYHCVQCSYVAHVRCVITEVIQVLKGDLKDVELRTVRKINLAIEMEQTLKNDAGAESEIEGIGELYLNNILKRLTSDEKKILKRDFYWDNEEQEEQEVRNNDYEIVDKVGCNIQKPFQQIDRNFMHFTHRLHYMSQKSELEASFLTLKMVGVEGYMVPKELGGILSNLLDKYGDISSDSDSTADVKSLCFSLLCQVINSMLETHRVTDITEYMLADWYRKLKFVRNRGFEIEFVVAYLENLMFDYYSLQEKRPEEHIIKELVSIEESISRLRSEIANREAEKEKHNELLDKFKRYHIFTKSQMVEECKIKPNRKIKSVNLF